jgi:hypothetical protein
MAKTLSLRVLGSIRSKLVAFKNLPNIKTKAKT